MGNIMERNTRLIATRKEELAMRKRIVAKVLAICLTVMLVLPAGLQTALASGTTAGITFEPGSLFTVYYNGGEGYTGIVPREIMFAEGETFSAAGALEMAEFSFTGWKYSGPMTVSSGNVQITEGSVIAANSAFVMPGGDVTLTAQWIRVYTVTFDRNDGGIDSTCAAVFVPRGGNIGTAGMPSNPSRSGYSFVGWNRDKGICVNESASIAAMQIYDDFTVFAQWGNDYEPPPPTEPPPTEQPPTNPPPTEQPPTNPPPTEQPPTNPPPTEQPPTNPPPTNPPPTNPPPTNPPPTNPPPTNPPPTNPPPTNPPPTEAPPESPPPTSPPVNTNPPPGTPIGTVDPDDGQDNSGTGQLTDEQPTDEGETRDILGNDVPRVSIGKSSIPLFAPDGTPTWALLNLLLCVSGIIYAAVTTVRAVRQRNRQTNEENEKIIREKDSGKMKNPEDGNDGKKLRLGWFSTAMLMGIVGVVLFLVTQDMRNLMVLVDWWTLAHIVLLAVEVFAVILVFKKASGEKQKVMPHKIHEQKKQSQKANASRINSLRNRALKNGPAGGKPLGNTSKS